MEIEKRLERDQAKSRENSRDSESGGSDSLVSENNNHHRKRKRPPPEGTPCKEEPRDDIKVSDVKSDVAS